MAAVGNAQFMASNYYDQTGYISPQMPAVAVGNGREAGFSKPGQVNHDDPPFSRYKCRPECRFRQRYF